jgi:hypothetical protein
MDQVVVLRNDLRSRPGKVKSERLLRAAKVVELEDEMLGEIALIPPDDPANTCIDEAELVAADVDRLHPWEFKVPLLTSFGVREWGDEASRGSL